MSIQLYLYKKNFEVQKAERYLKERKITYQMVDLKKHRLGRREIELFAQAKGVKSIINFEDEKVKSHPIAHTFDSGAMIDYLLEKPEFLISPIIRMGQKILIGFNEEDLNGLING